MVSANKIKSDALEILTGLGGQCDPYAPSVKDPEMMLQIIKESLDAFVAQNPQPQGQSAEELADAFLHHMATLKKAGR